MSPLTAIKLAHTVVWAFFVACILAIPFFAASARFDCNKEIFGTLYALGLAFLLVCWLRGP